MSPWRVIYNKIRVSTILGSQPAFFHLYPRPTALLLSEANIGYCYHSIHEYFTMYFQKIRILLSLILKLAHAKTALVFSNALSSCL